MSRKAAYILSYLFHPLILSSYLMILFLFLGSNEVFHSSYNLQARWLLVLIVLLTSFIIPVLSIVLLKMTNMISSLHLENRKERLVPFFYTACFYAFTAYLFARQVAAFNTAAILFIGNAIIIVCITIITMRWKISVHCAGIGGVTGYLMGFKVFLPSYAMGLVLAVVLLIAGIVIAARLKLNAHTPKQAYVGFGLGVLISFVTVYWI